MAALTSFLQREFCRQPPVGWTCRSEVRLLPLGLERLLGYSSRVDVLFEQPEPKRRLWIEFEVSRADPVANHAKFLTSHLFEHQLDTDCFISMVSAHVSKGRRNLAANTISVMRQVGMEAYQTLLFPQLPPDEIKRLNHLELAQLENLSLPVESEIERAIAISEPLMTMDECEIHLAGDLLIVFLNLRQWNDDLSTEDGRKLWGCRTVTYFAYAAESGLFAPSKFCAYSAVPLRGNPSSTLQTSPALGVMTTHRYSRLNDGTHRLDGHRAVDHLTGQLGMLLRQPAEVPEVAAQFEAWLGRFADCINIHPRGPQFVLPPLWYA
jgi:hypothetical protein